MIEPVEFEDILNEVVDRRGAGARRMRVYDMPIVDPHDYWLSVTDVPCPIVGCPGMILWYEAAYVPGYRICDDCQRRFFARGTIDCPTLVLDSERGCLPEHRAAFRAAKKRHQDEEEARDL